MLSALKASEILGQASTRWKLADNTWVTIGLDEMEEALALSILEKGKILSAVDE